MRVAFERDFSRVAGSLLSDFQIAKRVEQTTDPNLGGPALMLPHRPEVNGYVNVDVRHRKWPGHMGDPKTAAERLSWT